MTAHAFTFALLPVRYGAIYILNGGVDNFDDDADVLATGTLPSGFGNCMLLETMVFVGGIDTPLSADLLQRGMDGYLIDDASVTMDWIGGSQLFLAQKAEATFGGGVFARLKADQPVLWKANERMLIRMPDLGAAAGDTGDLRILPRVRRLRT